MPADTGACPVTGITSLPEPQVPQLAKNIDAARPHDKISPDQARTCPVPNKSARLGGPDLGGPV
jgi:hypothetical protein